MRGENTRVDNNLKKNINKKYLICAYIKTVSFLLAKQNENLLATPYIKRFSDPGHRLVRVIEDIYFILWGDLFLFNET